MRLPGPAALAALIFSLPLAADDTSAPAAVPLAGAGEWRTLPTEAYRGKRDSVSFVDASHGWYGTGAGDFFATKDGGANWEEVCQIELIRKASFLAGGDTGYATVQSYEPERSTQLVIRSDNKGRTWREIEMAQDKTARLFAIGTEVQAIDLPASGKP